MSKKVTGQWKKINYKKSVYKYTVIKSQWI